MYKVAILDDEKNFLEEIHNCYKSMKCLKYHIFKKQSC